MKKFRTIPIGIKQAIHFVRKHHGMVSLPNRELFAFAENVDNQHEVYAVVSEAQRAPEPNECVHAKTLAIGEYHFESLVEKAQNEARECKIAPPYTVTLATRIGVVTYMQKRIAKQEAA